MEPSQKLLQSKRTNVLAAVFAVVLLYGLIFFGCAVPTPTPTPTPVPTVAPTASPTPSIPTVYFDPGSSLLKPSDTAILDSTVHYMIANPNAKLAVNGYTSAMGTESEDTALSMQRDQVVAEYLETHGVSSKQITLYSFGKAYFVSTNKTPEGRALNDRVELVTTP